jgi:hypothetical protein
VASVTGLLMKVEQMADRELAGETEVPGENPL